MIAVAQPAQAQATGEAPADQVPDGRQQSAPPAVATGDIVVTGSRIRRAELDGSAPVSVIQGKDLDSRGFRNVFDALTQLPQNSGSVQGEDFGSTFTPAANVISLRGLGPNHTLTLINGRRLADYPVAYEGAINAVNLANIPNAVVQQIDVLTGGAGAIYGSDAIAGVVNIQLRKAMEGLEANIRDGVTEQGRGRNTRVQVAGGHRFDRLSVIGAVEYTHRDPIVWGDRDLTRDFSRVARPTDAVQPMFAIANPAGRGRFYDPPAGACDRLSGLQGETMIRVPGRTSGSYCSSNAYYSGRTIQTRKDSGNGYLSAAYDAGGGVELFGDLLYGKTRVENVVRSIQWARTFYNDTTGRLESWTRVFTAGEAGRRFATSSIFDETSWNGTLGLRGRLGNDWRYEASYNRSEYVSVQRRLRLLTSVDDVFLGAQQGTLAVAGSVQPRYAADPARLWTPLTPAQFGAITRRFAERDTSNLQDVAFSANGDLFRLPAGMVQAAVVVEGGSQGYSNRADPALATGIGWNTSRPADSGGERQRKAIGAEVRLPLLKPLTATVAGRYDRYTYRGHAVAQGTYTLGLQLRPVEQLLLRGSYATSFRAPDMNYIFASEVRGYTPGATDYYQCRLAKQEYASCDIAYNMDYTFAGNAGLKPERGRSWTAGAVWTPSRHFNARIDYYDISLNDQVTNLSSQSILSTEADCRLGASTSGSTVDPGSALCRDYVARVVRNAGDAAVDPNRVTRLLISPINAARERVRGIDAAAEARWSFEHYGTVSAQLAYARTFRHEAQQFAGDPMFDLVNDPAYQSDWRDRGNATITWEVGPVHATLYGIRYGAIPTADSKGRYGAYTLFNTSIAYDVTPKTSVTLIVNNIADRYPVDTSAGFPGYNIGWYDVVGRQAWLQVSVRL
jgi:outer membrane receptor protein involved in Fe transport